MLIQYSLPNLSVQRQFSPTFYEKTKCDNVSNTSSAMNSSATAYHLL